MLTIDELKKMKPGTVFASGEVEINHPYYGQAPEYPKTIQVRWVAIRGGIHDWAIYTDFDRPFLDNDAIAAYGVKLHDIGKVMELVMADFDAMEMYRH
jgi:hypothetical protein